jgi:hypothetical protein
MVCEKTGFKNNESNRIEGFLATQRDKEEVEMCKYFIRMYFTTSSRYEKEHSSYGLKHQVEHWARVCDKLGVK